jgi:type IV pilus assembly protein PilV
MKPLILTISNQHKQHGIGLVEVLVALLLLAIGVIGFAGLQVRAVAATNEAFQRSQAMAVARDAGERIRVNTVSRDAYNTTINWTSSTTPKDCTAANCTTAELATYDIGNIRTLAKTVGANGDARMQVCSGNIALHCLYIAWGNTLPVDANSADDTSCTVKGSLQPNSSCVVLETY